MTASHSGAKPPPRTLLISLRLHNLRFRLSPRDACNQYIELLKSLPIYYIIVVISAVVKCEQLFPAPCPGIPIVDLLKTAVPSLQDLPDGVNVIYDKQSYAHGFQFSPNAHSISLKAEAVFEKCNYFPFEFSFFITYKKFSISKREQCILSLVQQNNNRSLVSVRVVQDRIVFTYKHKHYSFKMAPGYQTRKWHTLAISLASQGLSVTLDCHFQRVKLIKFSFPDIVSVVNTTFLIGRCSIESTLYQGLIQSILLLPGRDASVQTCSARIAAQVRKTQRP
uniref:Laminin G domain-containing protein n=1 Tax=Biomphalaria glabrata TaxID=6526 RepID=A0A2C9KM81_BIOGL